MKESLAWSFALAVLAVGCAQEGTQSQDAGIQLDATDPAAAYFERCGARADYGDLGILDGATARWHYPNDINSETRWGVAIENEEEVGRYVKISLLLEPGYGYFPDGILPGVYPLKGPELTRETCSACVAISSRPSDYIDHEEDYRCYFATGGTLTLTETEEKLTGSLEHVTFRRIQCWPNEPVPANDCSTSLESVSFDESHIGIIGD